MTGELSATQPKPKRELPLWRRIAVGAVQVGAAVFAAFHLYALALTFLPAPGTILMSQRAGQGEEVRHNWRSLEKISPQLVLAVIAAEDAQFCNHGGIDWDAVEKAREWNRKNPDRNRRGGSTISQQTAKNVFFWNGGGMPRKAGEAWMTYVIEAVWGKRRIMEVYLNVAEWGDGLFGAEAAAQERFGKSAEELTAREAALLAAVLPSPNKWRAVNPGPYVQKRAGSIQGRMRVVANEGFAACVLGDEFRVIAPKSEPGEAPRPAPVFEDLPEAPDTGEEALETVPEPVAAEPDPILDAADEIFSRPDAQPAVDVESEAQAEAPPAEEVTEVAPDVEDEGGPKVITPQ